MIGASARALIAALAASLAIVPAAAEASEPWQPDSTFSLSPQLPGAPTGTATLRYRLLDRQGEQIGAVMSQPTIEPLRWIHVPLLPGIYTVEAWAEDAGGAELSRGSATLYFDNASPAPPTPHGTERWLLGSEAAQLRIEAPPGSRPLSGLRGYAISLDRGGGSSPCAVPTLCTVAETDVPAGDDSFVLGTLPEGSNYVRLASVSGAGVPSQIRTVTFRVDATPPQVSLLGVPAGWSSRPVELTALAHDSLSGVAASGPSGPLTAIAVEGGAPAAAAGARVSTLVSGSGVHTVAFYARDAAGNTAEGAPGGTSPRTETVRIDEDRPSVRFAPTQDPTEPERIEALVADALSGPSPSKGSIAVRLTGTRARFEELPTKVAAGRLVAHWDSDSYPPGKYEFLATGFDLAGNAATGSDRVRGGRMVLVNPLKTPVTLIGRLSGNRFHGRLQRVGGGPVAQHEVVVVERFASGAEPRSRVLVARTDPRGAFSVRLGPGPSREVAASFAGTPGLSRATSASVDLDAPTGLRLRASSPIARVGGQPILFTGTVGAMGARRAARGLPVELQFRYPGAGWSGFRTVEADRRGRFRYAYRFSDDDSRGIRFQFRAYVKGREGWPYEPGTSRPVTVTGR